MTLNLTKKNIDSIRQILKGNFKKALLSFEKKMKFYAQKMEFEKAQWIKDKIKDLKNFQSKSTIVNQKINNVDVFSIFSDESYGYINYLQVSYGAIVRSHTVEIKKKLDESNSKLLQLGIIEIRQLFSSNSKIIFLSDRVFLR